MGLMEKIAEGREALNAELGVEIEKPDDAPVEESDTEDTAAAEDGDADDGGDTAATEDGKGVEKPDVKAEEKPDNAAMARMRREAAAAKKAEAEAREELERLRKEAAQPKQQPAADTKATVDDPEPDQDDVEAHLKWQIRQQNQALEDLKKWKADQTKTYEEREAERKAQETYRGAIAEFTRLENEFIKQAPDYEAVTKHMHGKMTDAVKALYPMMPEDQVVSTVNNQILNMASQFAKQHLNPVEELYYLAQERYGAPEAEDKSPEKASVEKIADVRKRSASSLSGGGQSTKIRPPRTAREVAAMSREQRAAYIKSLTQ